MSIRRGLSCKGHSSMTLWGARSTILWASSEVLLAELGSSLPPWIWGVTKAVKKNTRLSFHSVIRNVQLKNIFRLFHRLCMSQCDNNVHVFYIILLCVSLHIYLLDSVGSCCMDPPFERPLSNVSGQNTSPGAAGPFEGCCLQRFGIVTVRCQDPLELGKMPWKEPYHPFAKHAVLVSETVSNFCITYH